MYSRFEELLKLYGTTAYKVSKATGINRSIFTFWKNGKHTPGSDKLTKIAEYFCVSLDWLTGISDSMEPVGTVREPVRKLPKDLMKLLDEEELALNGKIMSPNDKKKLMMIIEAAFWEAKEMNGNGIQHKAKS